jgi:hypothetical protein
MTKEQIKSIYGRTIGKNAFWAINKHLTRLIELEPTQLLQHLIDLDNLESFKDLDWIYQQYHRIAEDLCCSEKKVQRNMKILKDLELIQIEFRGQPAKNYYKIDYNNIHKIMESSSLTDFVLSRDSIFGAAYTNT